VLTELAAPTEFGTGLRARLELVRERQEDFARETLLKLPVPARRDFSPELALVSPDLEPGFILEGLAETLLGAHEVQTAPLGALLTEAGLLDRTEIDYALACARESGKRLGEVLVEHGLVSPQEVVRLVAAQRGLPFVDVRRMAIDPAAAKLFPAELAHDFRSLPIGFVRGLPVVAVADPTDDDAMHGTRSVLHCVRFVASPEDAILFQLARVYIPGSQGDGSLPVG